MLKLGISALCFFAPLWLNRRYIVQHPNLALLCPLLLALSVAPSVGAPVINALVSFNGTNGAAPSGGLIQATNGDFYGTTFGDGVGNFGTIFHVNPAGALSNLVTFDGTSAAHPAAGLTQGRDGSFYGTVTLGGSQAFFGAIFRVAPSGAAVTNLASFTSATGYDPEAGLVQSTNGNFYGTTFGGGDYSAGTIFKLTPDGVLTTLYSFDGTNGAYPYASLVQGRDGDLYGTTSGDGAANFGSVFKLAPSGTFTNLVSFDGANGASPRGTLVQGSDGNFYGTTLEGGTNNAGTVFRMTPSGTLTSLFSFDPAQDANPYAGLIQAVDGNFYGTTLTGGAHFYGALFRLTPAGALTSLVGFNGSTNGGNPYGVLLQGADGALYGTAQSGGIGGNGVVFRISELPFISAQPASQIILPGTVTTLAVSAGGGFSPLSFQWFRNGSLIDGSTNASLLATNQGTYLVIVSNAFGTLTSSNAVLTFPDRVNPTVSISSPGSGLPLTNPSTTVFGEAGDDVDVASVFYQFNNGPWLAAETNQSWPNWSATLTLLPGTNLFSVYSLDTSTNSSPTNTLQLVYTPVDTLTVQIQGQGTVSPDLNGQPLVIGKTYTLTAIPASGWAFAYWSPAGASPSTLNSQLSTAFVMQPNLVVKANFIPVRFAPKAGGYNGLFYPQAGTSPTNSGAFTLNMSSSGSFTARARFGSAQASFAGRFTNAHAVVTSRPSGAIPVALTLALRVDVAPGSAKVAGALSDGVYVAQVQAALAGVSPVAPPFGDKLYTIALAPATNGSGWGALTGRLKSQGRMTVTGTLGDGTKISQSTLTSTNGDFPLFLPLSRGKGMLLGWLALAGDTPRGEHILWMRPSETAGLSTSNAFTVMPEVFGSLYTAPRAGANLLSLTTGVLVFSRGNALTTALTNSFALAKNKIRFSTNPDQLALKLNLANGTFSGTFLAPGTVKKTPFVGVVLQQYNQGVGNFRDADKSGEVLLLDAKP